MGREIRRVPANWEHPKDAKGDYIPLHDGFSARLASWTEGKRQWDAGMRDNFRGGWIPRSGKEPEMSFEEWDGKQPVPEDYMPEWPEEQKTHLMMYETCSEGTPISPAFATPEELAHWLANTGASAFGGETATYEQWLDTCKRGYAPSAFLTSRGIESGVAGMANVK